MGTVFARGTSSVTWSQGRTTLRRNEPYDDQSAIVRERPDLFETSPDTSPGSPLTADAPPGRRTRRARG
jgi:hypothetical protein